MDLTDFSDLAEQLDVPVYKVSDINSQEAVEQMRALKPDIGMSLGWKQIIRPTVLGVPPMGWIGCHPGKLLLKGESPRADEFCAPGNEPMNYAILGGFKRSGTTLFWLKKKIDAGEIFARGDVEIDVEHETACSLVGKMAQVTGRILDETLPALVAGNPPRLRQEMQETQPYTKPLKAEESRIDPAAPIEETYRLIRACVYPYPNAYFEFYGQRIYVEHARVEDGVMTELKTRTGGSPYARD